MARRLSLNQFQAVIAKLDSQTEKAAIRGFRRAGAFFLRTLVVEIGQTSPHPAVDTGELRNSADITIVPDGCIVAVDAPHAPVIEYGRRPGGRMPPVQAIADWMRRKRIGRDIVAKQRKSIRRQATALIGKSAARAALKADRAGLEEQAYRQAAFMMARAIQRNGIAPRHYFRKAWDRSVERMTFIITHEIATAGWRPTPAAKRKLEAALKGAA